YEAARRLLQEEGLPQDEVCIGHAALDNGEALIEMMEGRHGQALQLEIRAIQRLEGIPITATTQSLRLQALINAARLCIREGNETMAKEYLIVAEQLAAAGHSGWMAQVLQ
ncbi:hypothetical protein BZG24_30005, partial [Escherichia coli]|uniref:hypothetical protein n=1 Tax=Escherichia coli TaxID=562 RepID=UPI0022B05E38